MNSIQTELPRIIRIAKWLAWGSVLAFLVKLSTLLFLAPSSVLGNMLSLGGMGFYSPTSIIFISFVQYSLIATAYGLLLTREARSHFTKQKS